MQCFVGDQSTLTTIGVPNHSFDLGRQSSLSPPDPSSHPILTTANLPCLERRKNKDIVKMQPNRASGACLCLIGPNPQTPKNPFFSHHKRECPFQANPIRVVDSPHHSCSSSRRRSLPHVPYPHWIQPGYGARVRQSNSIKH